VSLQFAVVHEARADFHTATELADRQLIESVEWLKDAPIEYQRSWLQESVGGAMTWTGIKLSASEARISAIGSFGGESAEPDAQAARRAIRYLRYAVPDLAGVVLIRDQDDEPERRTGLEQARREHAGRLPIVVGLAVVKRECWVLAGFDPQDDAENLRLATERQTLGFDPRSRSHDLAAGGADNGRRSPKRVLRALCGGDADRERRCWSETKLEALRDRGAENGLRAFLDEVRDRLAGLIGHIS
jgi:hypothetical protein